MKKFIVPLAALTLSLNLSRGEGPSGVPVMIPAYAVEGAAQPPNPKATAVFVTSGGKQIVLPPSVNTFMVKEGKGSNENSRDLIVRDNRWTQSLLKLDLSPLQPADPVDSAAFRFKVASVERSGNAIFNCYRMLVNWSPNATWFKPDADKGAVWNGLKPGVDFEAKPFATFETPDLKKGDVIEIPGFADAVKAWQTSKAPNYGFLLTLSGKSLQANFPGREPDAQQHDFLAGGPANSSVTIKFDPALISRVMLRPDDLLDAALHLRVTDFKKAPPGATLRVLSAAGKLLATVPLTSASPDGYIDINGLVSAAASDPTFQIQASAPMHIAAMGAGVAAPQLQITVRDYPKTTLFDHEVKPQSDVYNTVKDGHFYYGGKRLRLWGMVGYGDADRLRKMGFNAQRVWDPSFSKIYGVKGFPIEIAERGELPPSVKGDGSLLDNADKHFADLKAHGMFVMFATTSETLPLKPLLADDSFIAGGPDWNDWKAAVQSEKNEGSLVTLATFFDDRLKKIRMKSAKAILDHVNPYTGKRYAEEENIAVYEVWNENGGVYRFLNEDRPLPPFFEKEAQAKWSAWLRAKYKTGEALKAAWGKLDPGETLDTVKRAPSLANAQNYPEARARDYSEFLYETVTGFDNDYRNYCRSLAPKGKGVNVVPFSFDTQYRPSVPWLHVDAQGDVNSPGMYFWTLKTTLDAPPSAYVIDSHTVYNMPTVLYETNQARPDPERTEYPLKLAALASWQDWDGIFWHYWAASDMKTDEDFMAAVMPQLTVSHIWTGVHHDKDPVMTSAMALAGRIFLNYEIKPAPAPTIFHIGKPGIFGFDFANGIGAGRATFERGSRIKFEPDSDTKLTVENPVPDEPIRAAVKSGDEILWDWPNARLIIDSPGVKAYVGKVSPEPYKFSDGTVLSGINTPWICWALSSADGKPLAETKRAFVTAVYDARNTDFKFDWSVAGSPVDQAKAIRNRGRGPAIVDKVDYTLSFPEHLDYQYSGYDFATRKIVDDNASDSNVLRVKNHEIWMGVIDFLKRGSSAEPVVDANTGAQKALASDSANLAESTDPKLAGVWNPIPGVSWGDTYSKALHEIRDLPVVYTSLNAEDTGNSPDKTINWSESQALFSAPANIDVSFKDRKMVRIVATFTRPPDMKAVVAAYEKQFGPALEKTFARQEEQSIARWSVKQPGATVDIKVTELQGTLVITYDLTRS